MTMSPLHPALVHLPIALIIFSFIADVLAKITRRQSLADAGFWSLVGGLIGGVLTIAAGYWDMSRAALNDRTHEFVDQHLIIGWAVAVCLVILTTWRWRIRRKDRPAVTRPYIAGATVTVALTLFQGWYGGEMVFAHGAGVAAAGQGTESAQDAKTRLARVHDALKPLGTALGGSAGSESGRGHSGDKSKDHKH